MTIGKLGDPNGLTQLSDNFAPTAITKDGSPVGNLTSVEIDENGFINATYDTGFTRKIYQIPLVDVPNPNGLFTRERPGLPGLARKRLVLPVERRRRTDRVGGRAMPARARPPMSQPS